MTSKLNVNNLGNQADTKEASVDDILDGRSTAWANFNGTGTVAIRDSHNISSITDNGVGDYTANFATAMNNANFCAVTSAGGAGSAVTGSSPNIARTVNDVGVRAFVSTSSAAIDVSEATVAVFGGV